MAIMIKCSFRTKIFLSRKETSFLYLAIPLNGGGSDFQENKVRTLMSRIDVYVNTAAVSMGAFTHDN